MIVSPFVFPTSPALFQISCSKVAASYALSLTLIVVPSFRFCEYGIGLYGVLSSLMPANFSLMSRSFNPSSTNYFFSACLIALIFLVISLTSSSSPFSSKISRSSNIDFKKSDSWGAFLFLVAFGMC